MQLSVGQSASRAFSLFTSEPSENERFISLANQGRRLHPQAFDKVNTLSDWLELWLACGEGTEKTGGDFAIYLQAVVLTMADQVLNPTLYPKVLSVLPIPGFGPADSNDTDEPMGFNDPEYIIPLALSREHFSLAKRLDDKARSGWINRLLKYGSQT